MENKNIKVERETFTTKDNKTYFSYFIKGTVRGKEVKIGVVPHDNGGYVVLDIVFGDEMEAELCVKPFEMKDDNGKVTVINTFTVISADENGEVYECPIKPNRKSDKTLLSMLIR